MDREIVEKVIEKLGSKLEASGKLVQFNDASYKPVELSKNNFNVINESPGNAKIAFIDGGNNSVLDAASFCLQMVRTYCTVYSGNKREKSGKNEFLLLVSAGNDIIDADAFGTDIKFSSFNMFDKTLAKGSHRVIISDAAAACRKLAEIREAAEAVEYLEPGDIIVLDRDLKAEITGEKELLDKLYINAEKKGVIVCGISKTTRLFTDTGDSAAAAVSAIAPDSEWAYYPVADIENETHKAEICFVKLHKSSKYVFRFEIYKKQKSQIGKVLSALRKNSKDPVFIGYPYGLIEADKFARVSNDEAEYLKVRLISKAGKQSSKIISYMKTVDAHSILDNIA